MNGKTLILKKVEGRGFQKEYVLNTRENDGKNGQLLTKKVYCVSII